ncbi:hypothetical protein OC845_006499, partial [Tilletia horrida]
MDKGSQFSDPTGIQHPSTQHQDGIGTYIPGAGLVAKGLTGEPITEADIAKARISAQVHSQIQQQQQQEAQQQPDSDSNSGDTPEEKVYSPGEPSSYVDGAAPS